MVQAPVVLDDQSRLVYTPHTYGPGVHALPYMESEDFPDNTGQVSKRAIYTQPLHAF